MGKRIRAYKVTNLSKVDTTLYIEGDHFITDRSVGVLVNGRIKTIGNEVPDLSKYAKKTDIPDVSDFVDTETVQQMIDEAIEKIVNDQLKKFDKNE